MGAVGVLHEDERKKECGEKEVHEQGINQDEEWKYEQEQEGEKECGEKEVHEKQCGEERDRD